MLEVPIVDPVKFLEATRESGYHDLASALAELVDNSIEAGARTVDITIGASGADGEQFEVWVLDDGTGMSATEIRLALQFGGTRRFNSRSGLGRFGMGLPNASLSQARRVELYSWRKGRSAAVAILDIDRVRAGHDKGVQVHSKISLPPQVRKLKHQFTTAVRWCRCDRHQSQNGQNILNTVAVKLGRSFRDYISQGLRLYLNGTQIDKLDPLRILPSPDHHKVELLPPLQLPFVFDGMALPETIQVSFAVLPLEAWSRLSNRVKSQFHITRSAGVSVVRANREIAYGWYFLGDKRKENYDDWWRCEIRFNPNLDSAFGVTHTKQGIRPTKTLTETLVPAISRQARVLNRAIRARFEALAAPRSSAECLAERRHHLIQPPAASRNPTAFDLKQRSSGVRYRLRLESSDQAAFCRVVRRKNVLTVYINRLHSFYTELYKPLTEAADLDGNRALNGFVLAMGRAMSDQDVGARFVDYLSDVCELLLRK